MDPKQVRQISMRVRVKRTYSMPELKGQVGTINQRYGGCTTQHLRSALRTGGRSCSGPTNLKRHSGYSPLMDRVDSL